MKQIIATFVLVIVITGLLVAIIIGSRKNQQTQTLSADTSVTKTTEPTNIVLDSKIPIFYYGNTCPHCEDVEEWMRNNDIEAKITIVKKEVYDNYQNSQELTQVAKKCGMPTDSIGVPFLYAEEKCLVGTPDIISYLEEKTNE